MTPELERKVLKLAAQICWMHGEIAGNRICQDWSGDTDFLDLLTPEDRDALARQYEQYNSEGRDFEPGYFPYDEMMISFVIARALETMAKDSLWRTWIQRDESSMFGSWDKETD